MSRFETEQALLDDGLVAIVRGDFSVEEQEAVAGALLAGGVRVLEVTLNTTAVLGESGGWANAFRATCWSGPGPSGRRRTRGGRWVPGRSFWSRPVWT